MTERRGGRRVLAMAGVVMLSVLAVMFGLVGTASAAEDISSCTHINESGTYQLSGDIQPSDPEELTEDTCILINSSDVTLDGTGNTVDGSGVDGTYGIQVENTTAGASKDDPTDHLENVTIRNVVLDHWPGPVALRGVNESEVSDLELRNTGNGADVIHEHGNSTQITNIQATAGINDTVVTVVEVDDSTVSNVNIERAGGDGRAIDVRDSPNAEIDDVSVDDRNNADDRQDFGDPAAIYVRDSPGAVVTDNTILDADMVGIRLTHISAGVGNPNALVAHNDLNDTAEEGIEVRRSDDATLWNNDLNETHGIRVEGSTGVGVTGNRLMVTDGFTGETAIELDGTTDTAIAANSIDGHFGGVYSEEAAPASVRDNRFDVESEGIYLDSGTLDSTGLVVSNNTILAESGSGISEGGIIVIGAEQTTISDNFVTGLGDLGVFIQGGGGHVVSNTTATGIVAAGAFGAAPNPFRLEGVTNTTVTGLNASESDVERDTETVLDSTDVTIEQSTFTGNTHGLELANVLNVTLIDTVVAENDGWQVHVRAGSTDVSASNVSIGQSTQPGTSVSFDAVDVTIGSTSSPPQNPGSTAIGRYFEATNLTQNAYLNVSLHYEDGDVSGVDESTLALWHHDGASWGELQGSTVNAGVRTISANVTEFSTFGGFGSGAVAQDPADFSVAITGTNSPVDEGETLTVDATVENTGDTQGTQSVTLSVDGVERDSQTVTLASGATTTVALSWATSDGDAGDYTATVASENDSATASVTVEAIDPEWPMFAANPAGTGHLDTTGPRSNITKRWNVTTGNWVTTAPVVADGRVYVMGDDGALYAIDAASGAEEWNFTVDLAKDSSPAVSNGTVYVGAGPSDAGKVYAVDAATGNERWNFSTTYGPESSPVVDNGTVYVGAPGEGNSGFVYAIDAETGAEQWEFTADHNVDTSPAVANGTVYVGSRDNNVYALDADTGLEQWNFTTGAAVESSPAVANGAVYVGSLDNDVYALDADTGAKQWNFTTGFQIKSSPAVADGTVYVGSRDHHVYALNATDGTEVWNVSTGDDVFSSPALVDGTVYVGSNDDSVYALDAETGTERWTYTTDADVLSSPAVVDGTLYVGSKDTNVYALAEGTGSAPDFAVSVDSTNSPVDEGETLTVDATVENTGDAQGTQSVTLSVDGTELYSKAVTLASGETGTVSLSWSTADGDAGDYTVTVASEDDSATASVTVESGSTGSQSGSSSPSPGSSSTTSPTATPTPTQTATLTGTAAPTETPAATPTSSSTSTAAPTETPAPSPTPTATSTTTEAPGQPGFGLLVALAAVALFGLSRRGRD